MGRKHKGNKVDGWVVIDKPVGVTSIKAVSKARWAFQAGKAGHAGTLDPLASGVLAIAFGEATKTVAYAQEGLKTYRFTIRLGQATATDDAEGAVTAESDLRPTDAQIEAALGAYEGDIEQVPPQFSAVKVEGERAYDLAREGVEMELAARPLYVESLKLIARPDADHAELELVCGKGGYVRSIARDLGRDLGCLAHVTKLRRLSSGGFTLEHAISFEMLDEIRHMGGSEHLLPVSTGLDDIPALAVPAAAAARLKQGQAVPVPATGLDYGDVAWASLDGLPVAIGTVKSGLLHPDRVFNLER
ncbi:MAG TPA: tRNA pseudouridine(55) synthase TruB [Thermohalobaculum sp.]|nr:tRNA pseudouridine(55) synthase TruB [Thermohalobaculum sp.]